MAIKVYDPTAKNNNVFLRMRASGSDTVDIIAVDHKGVEFDRGHLLSIGTEGVTFFSGVNSSLGFKLDKTERLVMIKD